MSKVSDLSLRPPTNFRGIFRDDLSARAVYSEAAGIERRVPQAVAIPLDADDVVSIVSWARGSGIPITPRGSGTSMAGGALGSGVIVDLSTMSAIGRVDIERKKIGAEPGALRDAVNATAEASGLRFPVDPSSGQFATIGGMVSTNAAGAHSLLYGSIRQWVTALDCVFADASRARLVRGASPPQHVPAIGRFLTQARPRILDSRKKIDAAHAGVRKDSSGYGLRAYAASDELIDLIVGSEGTLAIVVGVELALTDLPAATSGLLGAFGSLENAVAAAGKARELGAAACELLDKTFLDVAASGAAFSSTTFPVGTEAVLLAELEGDSDDAAQSLSEKLAAEFKNVGASYVSVARTSAEQNEIWELRHAASPILSTLDANLESMQFIEDGAVPPNRLADYVRGVRAALDSRGVRGVIFGHAGDAHVHVNPLIDVSKADWRDKVDGLLEDVVTLTSRLSGTLSGEHGDGRLRAPLLDATWPHEEVDLFAAVKKCFDPDGILNPGVKIAVAGQKPIGDVKYDPKLPALPAIAKKALDFVAAERAYATPRLSLIDRAE
ncbi:MAG: FAD-binding oxidoreductase [Gemmatimonadaceae bacterium]